MKQPLVEWTSCSNREAWIAGGVIGGVGTLALLGRFIVNSSSPRSSSNKVVAASQFPPITSSPGHQSSCDHDNMDGFTARIGALNVRRVCGCHSDDVPKQHTPVVLIHGMWHGLWYWKRLQAILSYNGITSYAIELRAGPLRFARHFVGDLRETFEDLLHKEKLEKVVLAGHSQGGILSQMLLRDVFGDQPQRIAAVALLGTIPLSCANDMIEASKELGFPSKTIISEMGFAGSLWFLLTGRILNAAVMKRIFFLNDTKQTTVCDYGMSEYEQRTLGAPSDGWPTQTHQFESTPDFCAYRDTPTLIVGAANDIIHQPEHMRRGFKRLFPHADEIIVPCQAHCFADPGWEETFALPLIDWIIRNVSTT